MTRQVGRRLALALPLALGGCDQALLARLFGTQPQAGGQPRYLVGEPYQTGGAWRYPREDFSLVETGIAVVAGDHPARTSNGEAFDQTAMAASHPTLQLPCVARVTNLDTGREVLVRINDRGPGQPGRALAVTRRAAQYLLVPPGTPFRMRLQVQEAESRALAAALSEAPRPPVLTAAALPVESQSLPPPPGARQADHVRTAASVPIATISVAPPPVVVPLRLPESVWQGQPRPGTLYIACGAFGRLDYATIMQNRLARFGARLDTSYSAPRDRAYRVRVGPLASIADADAMLARVLQADAPDAQIIVD